MFDFILSLQYTRVLDVSFIYGLFTDVRYASFNKNQIKLRKTYVSCDSFSVKHIHHHII